MNTRSNSGAHFHFFWNTEKSERAEVYSIADAMVEAAVKGGMDKEEAVRNVERIFSAGWSAGSDEEAFNSSEN